MIALYFVKSFTHNRDLLVSTMVVFYLEELASSVNSLMFELEENPAPTKSMEIIIKKISLISKMTMDKHKGDDVG